MRNERSAIVHSSTQTWFTLVRFMTFGWSGVDTSHNDSTVSIVPTVWYLYRQHISLVLRRYQHDLAQRTESFPSRSRRALRKCQPCKARHIVGSPPSCQGWIHQIGSVKLLHRCRKQRSLMRRSRVLLLSLQSWIICSRIQRSLHTYLGRHVERKS